MMRRPHGSNSSVCRGREKDGVHRLWLFFCLAYVVGAATSWGGTQTSTVLDAYTGVYELVPSFHLTVTREGRVLYLQATGQPRAPLAWRGEHEFVIVGSNLRVIFGVRRDTGEVVDLLFEQGGLGRRAVKSVTSVIPAPQPSVQLPSDVLVRYVGTYEEQPGFAITITYDGAALTAQLTDMPGVVLGAVSRTEFFYKNSNARVTFRVNEAEVVTGLILHWGGSDLELARLGSR